MIREWDRATRSMLEDRSAGAPPAGASEAELEDLERRLGATLDPEHRRYLGLQNGWNPREYGIPRETSKGLELASAAQLADPASLGTDSTALPWHARAGELERLGLDPRHHLQIGIDRWWGAVFVMPIREGRVQPRVIAAPGYIEGSLGVVEAHETFGDFLAAHLAKVRGEEPRPAPGPSRAEAAADAGTEPWSVGANITSFGGRRVLRPQDLAAPLLRFTDAVRPVFGDRRWTFADAEWDGGSQHLRSILAGAAETSAGGEGWSLTTTLRLEVPSGSRCTLNLWRNHDRPNHDQFLVKFQPVAPEEEPDIPLVDFLAARSIEAFEPRVFVAGNTRLARARRNAKKTPRGYRMWFRDDLLEGRPLPAAADAFTTTGFAGGTMFLAADAWSVEELLEHADALLEGLGLDDLPPLDWNASRSTPGGPL
ncbi:hypothetical protein FM112_10760 [Gulosibacter sp. 10]|nr:hypothetical protein FM112_10760 [Gulosibacter sp. 10]